MTLVGINRWVSRAEAGQVSRPPARTVPAKAGTHGSTALNFSSNNCGVLEAIIGSCGGDRGPRLFAGDAEWIRLSKDSCPVACCSIRSTATCREHLIWELEHVGGFFGIGTLAVESAGHRDDVRRGGTGHLELALGQGQTGSAACNSHSVPRRRIGLGGFRVGERRWRGRELGIGLELRPSLPPRGRLLIGVRDPQHRYIVERTADDLHRQWQAAVAEADAL